MCFQMNNKFSDEQEMYINSFILHLVLVYCEACIALAGEAIRCQICQSPHPGGFPKVCLEFDHFLEELFPEEYTTRRGTVQPKQVQFQHESSLTCMSQLFISEFYCSDFHFCGLAQYSMLQSF